MIYKKLGYDLLIINEDDYSYQKRDEEVITRCLKFLRNEI